MKTKILLKRSCFTFLFFNVFILPLSAQIHVAVSDFVNKSNTLFLDSWERSVPDLLRANLSGNEDLVILDRNRLDKVLEEQALTLSGLTDSSAIQSVGKLVGAEFILSGTVDKQNNEYVISADLIRVKTGQVQTEIVRSADREYLDEMIAMLANNLIYRLTGTGEYQSNKTYTSNSAWYWTGATVLLGTASLITNNYYHDNLDKYGAATGLKEFDKYYNNANSSKNLYGILVTLTGAALVGTIIDFLSGDVENEINSGTKTNMSINTNFRRLDKNEISFAVQIHF